MLMKHLLIYFAVFAVAIVATSCSKENISAEDFYMDSSRVATITIYPKNDIFNGNTITAFKDAFIINESKYEGQSMLFALSEGKLVHDFFSITIYFDDIDNIRVGNKLRPSSYSFALLFSSTAYNAILDGGKITLSYLSDDYVILHFDKVIFNSLDFVYVIDGYLNCRLYDGGGTVDV